MTAPEKKPDAIDQGVEASRQRLRSWPVWAQHGYALLVTAGWFVIIIGVALIVIALARDAAASAAIVVLVIWVAVFGVVTMTWLFWHMAVPFYADLATDGRFSAWRSKKLRRFDSWFSRVTLVVLLSIILLPALQLFE